MNRNRRLLLVIAAVAVLLVATSALTWRSAAAPAAQGDRPPSRVLGEQIEAPAVADPVPGGQGFVSEHALGFKPAWRAPDWGYKGVTLCNPGPSGTWFHATLSLPHGAVVNKYVVYFSDSDPSYNLSAFLYSCPLSGSPCNQMAVIEPWGSSPGSRTAEDTTIYGGLINNQSNAYLAEVYLPPNPDYAVCLSGVRVDYSFPTNVPLVQKNR